MSLRPISLALVLALATSVVAEDQRSQRFEGKAQPLPALKTVEAPEKKPTSAQLLLRAGKAEKAGEWEAAFSAYCELPNSDRTAPDVREKVNAALRRVQQIRRHRDAGYQQFVNGLPPADAVNLFGEVAAKVPGVFAEAAKATPQLLWSHGIEELDRALASPAFRRTFLEGSAVAKVEPFRARLKADWSKRTIADAREARSTLKQLLAAAQDSFPVRTAAALAVEFVCGACSGLDEYTVFLSPSQIVELSEPLDLSAYGLQVRFSQGSLVVEGVVPGSWIAFNTQQINKGDRVTRLNGQSLEMAAPETLADALRQSMNGVHELEVAGPGQTEGTLVRLPVVLPTVWHRLVGSKDGIGYVRIGEFHAATPRDLDSALAALKAQEVRAIVLDLRGNRGGSFVAAVEVARRFLPAGQIVTTQGQLGEVADRTFSSDFGMRAVDVPVVVLIDSETASAAEVVAAALRDNNPRTVRAVLVGIPTFGKGTIQYPLRLAAADEPDDAGKPRNRSGVVRITIARLVAPNGIAINGIGIAPDFLVSDPARQWEVAIERAVELIQPMRSPSLNVLPPRQ